MDEETPQTIRFHYLKNAAFRSIHADGMMIGTMPRGGFNLAFFTERFPIPRETVHELLDGRSVGDELLDQRVGKEGVVREIEADVVVTQEVLEGIYKLLGEALGRKD